MEARNRKLEDWYGKIKRGEIKLPRFQRFESWVRYRVCHLVETVIHNLPLGIRLVLEVGEKEKFISRYLASAPQPDNRVHEHLLDGQQRLTALWRTFHNNYQWETYFLYLKEFDDYDDDDENDLSERVSPLFEAECGRRQITLAQKPHKPIKWWPPCGALSRLKC